MKCFGGNFFCVHHRGGGDQQQESSAASAAGLRQQLYMEVRVTSKSEDGKGNYCIRYCAVCSKNNCQSPNQKDTVFRISFRFEI